MQTLPDRDVPEGSVMEAAPEDLLPIGTLGTVVRMAKLADGSMRVMVMGVDRARLAGLAGNGQWLVARPEPVPVTGTSSPRAEALKRNVLAQFARVIDLAPDLGPELHGVVAEIDDPGKLADFVAANLDLRAYAKDPVNGGISTKKFSQPFVFEARKTSAMLLGLWLVLGASHAFGAEMVIATKADNGREIKIEAGCLLRVELEQAGSAGYAWEIQDLDPEHFEVLEAGTTDRPGLQDIVGAVTARWSLLARKAGGAQIRLLHYRPWEGKANALETFVLKVEMILIPA